MTIFNSPSTLEMLKSRRSCRQFLDKPLEEAHRQELIECLRNAPTAHNMQNASVLMVEDPARKARLAELVGGQKHVAAAACNFIFLCDLHRFKRYADLSSQECIPAERSFVTHTADAVILAHTIAVAALALGMNWVYIGGLYRRLDQTMDFLELPPYVYPAVMLCVGYPDPDAREPQEPVRLPQAARVYSETYPKLSDQEVLDLYQPFTEQFEQDILGSQRRAAKAQQIGATNFMQYLLRSTDAPKGQPGELAQQDQAVRWGLCKTRLLSDISPTRD